jgi:hypothetical protein
MNNNRTTSPSPLCQFEPVCSSATVTPIQSPRATLCCGSSNNNIKRVRLTLGKRKSSQRLSTKAKKVMRRASEQLLEENESSSSSAAEVGMADPSTKSGPLQGACPEGVTIKTIMRRKFSWKNYPEVSPILCMPLCM